MFCPSCGVAVEPSQRFCNHCGAALQGPTVSPGASFPPPDTAQQRTARVDAASAVTTEPVANTPPARTEPIIAVPPGEIPPVGSREFDEMFGVTGFSEPAPVADPPRAAAPPTVAQPAAPSPAPTAGPTGTASMPIVAATPAPLDLSSLDELGGLRARRSLGSRYRVTVMALAIATAAVGVLAALTTTVHYRVTGDVVAELDVQMNDLTTNALGGAVIAAVLLVVGGAAAMSGRRFGAGLVGGAGLGLAGFMAWLASESVSLVDTLKRGFEESTFQYRLSTTLDIGFWLAVAAAALGIAVFAVSVVAARSDGRPGVPLTVGAFGMIGTATMALGPLLTTNGVDFVDNFRTGSAVGPAEFWKGYLSATLGIVHEPVPPVTVWVRVAMLVVLIIGGFVGFVAGTRWGLGVAAGSAAIAVWQWATSSVEAGVRPFGIAGGNRGMEPFRPHVVTTIGVVVVVVMLLVAAIAAYRPRRAAAATE